MDDRQAGIAKIRQLLEGNRIAMLTTISEEDGLRSRPMALQSTEFDGELWFFTEANSWKIDEIAADPEVNVSVSDESKQRYISLSGTAQWVNDREKIKELWSPVVKAWFPGGPDDPNLTLLRVDVTGAEYWDGPGSKIVQLFGLARAVVTGQKFEAGEHDTVNI